MNRKYIRPKMDIYCAKDLLAVLGLAQNQYSLTFDVYRMSMHEERIEELKEAKILVYLLDKAKAKDEKNKYMA